MIIWSLGNRLLNDEIQKLDLYQSYIKIQMISRASKRLIYKYKKISWMS